MIRRISRAECLTLVRETLSNFVHQCLIFARADEYSAMPPQFESVPLSDAMLAGMVAISADAIIAVNSAQRIVFYNAGAEQVFGYTIAEAIGRPLADLLPTRFRAVHAAESLG